MKRGRRSFWGALPVISQYPSQSTNRGSFRRRRVDIPRNFEGCVWVSRCVPFRRQPPTVREGTLVEPVTPVSRTVSALLSVLRHIVRCPPGSCDCDSSRSTLSSDRRSVAHAPLFRSARPASMVSLSVQSLVWLTAVAGRADAFLFHAFTAFPALKELVQTQTDTEFRIRLDIGNHKENHLHLDGLSLECLPTAAARTAVSLPGADGPHPQTSSGKREVRIGHMPCYIGMNGQEQVVLENGAWEMIWKMDDRQGSLIMGFDSHAKVSRNEHSAHLPAGRIYLSFPVWTPELLESAQERKVQALERRDEHAQEKDRCLTEMQATSNLFQKALLYRDAAAAHEKMDLTGWRGYEWIPDHGSGVVAMGDQVLIGQEGSVWTKGFDRFSPKKVLGKAIIRHGPFHEDSRLHP